MRRPIKISHDLSIERLGLTQTQIERLEGIERWRARPGIKLLGADPGLAHFGVMVVGVPRGAGRVPDLLEAGVFTSRPDDRKRGVRDADDVDRRVTQLSAWLEPWVAETGVRAICCEAMSYPRSSSAAAKLGMARALLVGLARSYELPLLVVSPQRVRDEVVGRNVVNGKRKAATKVDVEQAVRTACVAHAWVGLDGIVKGDREHAWDAAAAVLACLDTDVVRSLLRP